MSSLGSFYRSAVGKKALMGVSGLMLFGFVLTHMLGNLKMFQGAEKFNAYAEWLREIGSPALPHSGALWILRLGLIAAVVAHIASAWAVSRQSRAARKNRYVKRTYVQADYASRTMRWGGVIIALFVLYHLLHLTWGSAHSDFVHGDPYHNVVTGLQVPWVAAIYLLANVILGFHLFHGLWSLFQSLGWNHPRYNSLRRAIASAFAFIVTAGNLSFPIAVLTGVVS